MLSGPVLACLEWSKVGKVKALKLLLSDGEVELAARNDVVDLPNSAVVGNGHAALELGFKVLDEMGTGATD